MPNIKFSYCYRDSGNYKKFGALIFDNPESIDIAKLEPLIRSKLIDETWFYASNWQLPDLHFETWDNELDHTFHEFEAVEYTTEPANPFFCVKSFIKLIECQPTT